MLNRLAAPLIRPLIYPAGLTRRPARPDEDVFHLGPVIQRGYCVNPDGERAVVYFGGNAEDVTVWVSFFRRILPDHAVYLVNYRGYGAGDGRPGQSGMVDDAVALIDHAAAAHPGAPVAVVGRSIGSGVSMQVAARRRLSRLVLVTPFDSLPAVAADIVRPIPAWLTRVFMVDTFDSAAQAAAVTCPTLILRAGLDDVVHPARTDALVAAFERANSCTVEVVDFPRADHVTISEDPAYWRKMQEFLGSR